MTKKDAKSIHAELMKPFAAEDLGWRLQKAFEFRGQMTGIAVPYVTNRAIMNRLDSVVGPENWYNDFKPWHAVGKKESQLCGLSIYFEGRGFITKWDGAEDSDIESVKGGLSDSMKRAAVQWGIGRVLYNMDTVFVEVEQRGKSWVIKKNQRTMLDKAYLDMLNAMGLKPISAGGVQSLLDSDDMESDEFPADKPKRTFPPAIPARDTQPVRKPQQAPEKKPEALPKTACLVTDMRMQKGMQSTTTVLKLKNAESKEISAFAQGEHPMLVPGTVLVNTKLTTRQQDSVTYFILESYDILPPDQRAA